MRSATAPDRLPTTDANRDSSEDQEEEEAALLDASFIDPTLPFPTVNALGFNFDNIITGGQSWDTSMSFEAPVLSALGSVPEKNQTVDMIDKPADLENFEAMLHICNNLQQQHRSFVSGSSLSVKSSTLECLNSAIATSTALATPTLAASTASSALLPAVVHKIVDVCDLLVRDFTAESQSADQPPPDAFLCLQKLDLILLQVKMFSTRSGLQESAARALQVHESIQGLLKQHFRHWMWH